MISRPVKKRHDQSESVLALCAAFWYATVMELHVGNTTEVQAIIDAAPRGDVAEGNLRRLHELGGADAVLAAFLATASAMASSGSWPLAFTTGSAGQGTAWAIAASSARPGRNDPRPTSPSRIQSPDSSLKWAAARFDGGPDIRKYFAPYLRDLS